MPALTIWSPEDALLGLVAPLAAAIAAPGPAIVVDLDEAGPSYPGERTLADLVEEGPSRSELSPSRGGVALLRNGGVDVAAARPVLAAITAGWPWVVFRSPADRTLAHAATVPVLPLIPGELLSRRPTRPAVYQRGGWPIVPPGPGVVLPRPAPRTLAALLSARLPARDRWLRRWSRIWSFRWV